MKVYNPLTDKALPSYQVVNNPTLPQRGVYETHWEIDVPSKDGQTRERVITVRALSVNKAEVMCGRATLVWTVVRSHERFNPSEVQTSTSFHT